MDGTDDTGVQVMQELLYTKDSLQDEIALSSSAKLVSMVLSLATTQARVMELTSWLRIHRCSPAPRRNRMCTGCYRRICSRTRSVPCLERNSTPAASGHVASCSGEPNLILRARQMSHCQRGQPLTSLCKAERHGSIEARAHGMGCPQSLPGRLFGPFR